jgi:methionyl-tRNA formyltransferase
VLWKWHSLNCGPYGSFDLALEITILCSSKSHPVVPWLENWCRNRRLTDIVSLVHSKKELGSGNILFLISCSELMNKETRKNFDHTVVVHASDLPKGRGWSPHVWEILNGAEKIIVSALEAADAVDSGAIWAKRQIDIPKTALYDEINEYLFTATLDLMSCVCNMVVRDEKAQPQDNRAASYWPRREPADSEIDPNASIENQFNALRVCDPDRYPAFFKIYGKEFEIQIKRRQVDKNNDKS